MELMMTDVDGDAGIHPRKRVATYRAYHLDTAGRITKPALVFEAPDDMTAIARARALIGDGDQLEIWEGSRQVGRAHAPEVSNERR
jgi:DNA-binding transcriptional regulator/RsmH inhibitor MraZ